MTYFILWKIDVSTVFVNIMKVQWGPKQHWTLLTFIVWTNKQRYIILKYIFCSTEDKQLQINYSIFISVFSALLTTVELLAACQSTFLDQYSEHCK